MKFISKTLIIFSLLSATYITQSQADTSLQSFQKSGLNLNINKDNNSPFQEGVDYITIIPRVPISNDSDNVDIIDFFIYGCKPCSNSIDILNEWKKNMPYYARISLSPISPGNQYSFPARIYFTLEKLNRLDLQDEIMKASIDGKTDFTNLKVLYSWLESRNIKEQDFNKAFDSNQVVSKLYGAPAVLKMYQIQSIPAVVVDGHYIIPQNVLKDKQHYIDVLNYLVNKASKEHSTLAKE